MSTFIDNIFKTKRITKQLSVIVFLTFNNLQSWLFNAAQMVWLNHSGGLNLPLACWGEYGSELESGGDSGSVLQK